MGLTLEGGTTLVWVTNTECGGPTSMKECFSAKSVSILEFNILALWGELLVQLCVNPKFTLVPQFKC